MDKKWDECNKKDMILILSLHTSEKGEDAENNRNKLKDISPQIVTQVTLNHFHDHQFLLQVLDLQPHLVGHQHTLF